MIVPKPTDPEKLKKREEILRRSREFPTEELKKALEGIQAKKEQEEREKREQEEREKVEEEEGKTGEVPEEIKDFRRKWEEEIKLDGETKNKIIEATNRIAPKIKIEPDGSRMIEMKIGGKEYKILDVNAETHTDDEYGYSKRYVWMKKHEVRVGGMMGDNVDNWENEKLKEYVREEERKGFHIPKIEEMMDLLNELGEEAGIKRESDQIVMLMYLTGMYGFYWLSMGDEGKLDSQANLRSVLGCNDDYPEFDNNGTVYTSATLLMIASS